MVSQGQVRVGQPVHMIANPTLYPFWQTGAETAGPIVPSRGRASMAAG